MAENTPKRSWTFKRVWWGNDLKTHLRMEFNEDDGVYSISSDDKSWIMNKVKHQYTFDRVEKTTAKIRYDNIQTAAKLQYIEEHNVEFGQFLYFRGQAAEVRETSTFYQLLNVFNDKEKTVTFKRLIFELDIVKNSLDKEWKTKLRNAANSLELLTVFYQKVSDLDSVLALYQDETLLQDEAIHEDNHDSA